MVPIAAGGPTTTTASLQPMQAQLIVKPTAATCPPLNLHSTCKEKNIAVSDSASDLPSTVNPDSAPNVVKKESSDEETP